MEDTVFSSFVDIGAGAMASRLRNLSPPSPGPDADDDAEVPPILYAVQYFDSAGKMINCTPPPPPPPNPH